MNNRGACRLALFVVLSVSFASALEQTRAADADDSPAADGGMDEGAQAPVPDKQGAAPGGAAAQGPAVPAPAGQVLSVVCSPTHNVLTWKLLSKRNSNSVLRGVDGASNVWICGGPEVIEPCTNLDVNTFEDNDVVPGKVYRYTQKSAPGCASNTVTCPGGASSGTSCLTGGVGGGGTSGGGTSGGGTSGGAAAGTSGGGDSSCTGGNPQCICVKTAAAYGRYAAAAIYAIGAAYPGMDSKPSGMSDADATAAICAAYNASKSLGTDTACRSQGDEVVFEDPHAPNSRYPTISVDVITSAGAFWGKSIAACAAGVQ